MIAASILSRLLLDIRGGGCCCATTSAATTSCLSTFSRLGSAHSNNHNEMRHKANRQICKPPIFYGNQGRASLATTGTADVLPGSAGDGTGGGNVDDDDTEVGAAHGGNKGDSNGGKTDQEWEPPRHLSPSSLAVFKQCRKHYYYRHILRLPVPSTKEQVRGTVVHDVLSKAFDFPPESRNISNLQALFREDMKELLRKERQDGKLGYASFFTGRDQEREWAFSSVRLIANFLAAEEQRPPGEGDPVQLEWNLEYTFPDGEDQPTSPNEKEQKPGIRDNGKRTMSNMVVKGIIDRVDRREDGSLRVVDYKTGKVPQLKYNEATNKRIMDENFFQLQIYALLVQKVLGETPREMRLVYLRGPESVTRAVDPDSLPGVEAELRSAWMQIASALERRRFEPMPNRLCEWCHFKDICPAFN